MVRNLVAQMANDFAKRYLGAAEDIWPDGATLVCHTCWHEQHVTVDEIARYMAHGWPSCHGQTMSVAGEPVLTVEDVSVHGPGEHRHSERSEESRLHRSFAQDSSLRSE
jgi:hypothetical protein